MEDRQVKTVPCQSSPQQKQSYFKIILSNTPHSLSIQTHPTISLACPLYIVCYSNNICLLKLKIRFWSKCMCESVSYALPIVCLWKINVIIIIIIIINLFTVYFTFSLRKRRGTRGWWYRWGNSWPIRVQQIKCLSTYRLICRPRDSELLDDSLLIMGIFWPMRFGQFRCRLHGC